MERRVDALVRARGHVVALAGHEAGRVDLVEHDVAHGVEGTQRELELNARRDDRRGYRLGAIVRGQNLDDALVDALVVAV